MTVHGGLLRLATAGDGQVADLTAGVRSVVATSGVQHGVAVVFARGATVAVTTMEYEPGGVQDLTAVLDELVPRARAWEHNVRNGDTNAPAHVRAALLGPSESIPVIDGALALGTWQQVVLLDFDDRPREREVTVQVLS